MVRQTASDRIASHPHLGHVPDVLIAEACECSPQLTSVVRRRLGIPAYGSQPAEPEPITVGEAPRRVLIAACAGRSASRAVIEMVAILRYLDEQYDAVGSSDCAQAVGITTDTARRRLHELQAVGAVYNASGTTRRGWVSMDWRDDVG